MKGARRRHSAQEIAEKLELARRLENEGKSQREIAAALNISIMTHHRWRKRAASTSGSTLPPAEHMNPQREAGAKVAKLCRENGQLRRLVADLLLERLILLDDLKER